MEVTMAYMDQQTKNRLNVGIKMVLKKYKVKATLSVRHNSTLVLTLRSGRLDLASLVRNPGDRINHYDLSGYPFDQRMFLQELVIAMNKENYNRGDIATDTHEVGYYICIYVGEADRPYVKE
jgi:hypothetical protein